MRLDLLAHGLHDARDVIRHARSVGEVVRALLPPSLVRPLVLNDAAPSGPAADPAALSATLGALRRRLKADVYGEDGTVDYTRLAGADAFAELAAAARSLPDARLDLPTDAARIAFWVNLYNVLMLHGVVALGIRRSVMEVPSFFARVAYRVGGHTLTLDEIENGVLRRNSPHPVTGRRLFTAGDPRHALAPARLDPRIHVALVCGAKSCPPIALYDAERLDAQLHTATTGFVASGVSIDHAARRVTIPLVFRYYERDFGGPAGVREFVVRHGDGAQRDALARASAAAYRTGYSRYDWRLNARP